MQPSSKCQHGHYIPRSEQEAGSTTSSYCTGCQAESGIHPATVAISQFSRAINFVSKGFAPSISQRDRAVEEQDLQQDAAVVILKAIDAGHDEVYLRSSVPAAIRNHFRNQLRDLNRGKRSAKVISISDPVCHDDPQSMTQEEVIADYRADNALSTSILNQQVDRLNNVLSDFEREVVDLHLDGLSHREIASVLCIDKNTSSRA